MSWSHHLRWAVETFTTHGRRYFWAQVVDRTGTVVAEEQSKSQGAAERKAKRLLRVEVSKRAQLNLFRGRSTRAA